jgi:hypothetical protein
MEKGGASNYDSGKYMFVIAFVLFLLWEGESWLG